MYILLVPQSTHTVAASATRHAAAAAAAPLLPLPPPAAPPPHQQLDVVDGVAGHDRLVQVRVEGHLLDIRVLAQLNKRLARRVGPAEQHVTHPPVTHQCRPRHGGMVHVLVVVSALCCLVVPNRCHAMKHVQPHFGTVISPQTVPTYTSQSTAALQKRASQCTAAPLPSLSAPAHARNLHPHLQARAASGTSRTHLPCQPSPAPPLSTLPIHHRPHPHL